MTPIVVWCLAWKEVKIVNILEKLYYGAYVRMNTL